jgi:AcrR family transcriptional regulator
MAQAAVKERSTARGGTREGILARAVDLSSTEGLEGLTIGRLASEVGMSKSGLFRHFGSKDELQLATVDAAARRYVERVVAPAMDAPPGAERLQALCDSYFAHLEENAFAGGCFWAASSAEFDDRPGPVRDRIGEAVSAWLGLLAAEAERAGAEDPEQLAFELHSLALGANLQGRLLGREDGFARARAAVERLLAF